MDDKVIEALNWLKEHKGIKSIDIRNKDFILYDELMEGIEDAFIMTSKELLMYVEDLKRDEKETV